MPVNPNDNCHYIELGVSVEQVRFWEEEVKGDSSLEELAIKC